MDKRAFRVAFDFLQERIEAMNQQGDTPQYWQETGKKMHEAHAQHDTAFCRSLIFAAMIELERIAKGKRENTHV